MARRLLTVPDRVVVWTGLKAGWSMPRIERAPSVVAREIARNSTSTRGYRPVTADEMAKKRRTRPQAFKVGAAPVLAASVLADLKRSRTPRPIARSLRREATHTSVGPVKGSPAAQGHTARHETIYRYIYALPKGELARYGVTLASERTRQRSPKPAGQRRAPIVWMVNIDERNPHAGGRCVPGHWEGDLAIGARRRSGVATLAEHTTLFVTILALPAGNNANALADVLIENADALPVVMTRRSLIRNQGSEMARHAALTLATKMPVYFADPHSP